MSHTHAHDVCTPDRHRDARVAGLAAPTAAETPPKDSPQAHPVVTVTGFTLAAEVIERSRQVPVIVLVGSPLQSGRLRGQLTSLAEGAGLRWILGILDPDKDPHAAMQFRPRQLPSVFAVAGGTTVAVFEPGLPGRDIGDWVEEVLRSTAGRLSGLETEPEPEPQSPAPSHDPRLRTAAEAVDRGDFARAVAIYEEMLIDAPHDPVLLRARAAVSVLVRVADMDRTRDPIQAAAADPTDIDAALDAADALVMLDQPVVAVELLTARLPHTRERVVELLALLDPGHPVRQQVVSALYA